MSDFPPLPNFGPFPGPEGGPGYMGIREVIDNGNILNQDDCNDSLTSGLGTIVDYTAPLLNIHDYGHTGNFGDDDVFGVVTAGHRSYGGVNHLSMVAKGIVEIPTGGEYTFCLNSDDGFTLQFPGHDFTGIYGDGEIVPFANGSALQFWADRGHADTLGVINLPAGDHPFVLTYHEGISGAEVEFSAAPGARTLFSEYFQLIGGENVPAKPPVPNPPEISGGAGFSVTMVYQPYTAGSTYSDEMDSAIANVEAAWAGTLPGPNVVVTATTNLLNFKDPEYYAGGKNFPQQPFPGSDDGSDNNHFAMGIGGLPDVAVCGADDDSYISDVQSKLLGTGRFNSVSIINVYSVTPTLAQLQAFDAVLVYSNYQYNDSVALGDVMADYVDSGGGVVTAFGEGVAGFDMQGRWLSGGYRVLLFSDFVIGPNTLGTVHHPAHPTMTGVSSFNGGSGSYRPSTTTLSPGATLIAEWSDGMPLVAVKDIGGTHRVDLGFFAPSSDVQADSWDSTTDGDLLMANALEYVSRDPDPFVAMTIYDEGDYTFLILADDSSQFRILDLAGGDPCAWAINDYEISGGYELVRLPDGTGFRMNGCCVDAKGTIHLTPGDYEVQIMFNERAGRSYFGLWASKDGSKIFLLGDTTPVPAYPQINALGLACPYYLLGDANKDCRIDFLDFALTAMSWLTDCDMNPSDPACL